MRLTHEQAFPALKEMLGNTGAADWDAPEAPAIDRLRRAWTNPMGRTTVELAVLLRQALVHETARRDGVTANLWLPAGSPLQDFEGWAEVGLHARALDGGWLIQAAPWRPGWTDVPADGLDGYAASETPRRFVEDAPTAGDPFLVTLCHPNYQSVGQRAAVRAALTTPPGGTLAVGLATGEGKSLIFQLAAKVGFLNPSARSPVGITVVVTPTVALAIDHENSALEKGFVAPVAYRGGEEASNAALIAAIEAGEQSLCVASPEAICGPLRSALGRAAARGQLRALVVDEAHLIDTWGTGFRTEFQSLSGVRREWLEASPPEMKPRTLLLSATLTGSTLTMLRTLFAGPGPFESLSALRLRSEPDYWTVACPDEAVRTARVLEAVRHAPRPAILYVTRVTDAEAWRDRLRAAGFSQVATVHGETPGAARDAILRGWRKGDVDLVVATSAFGLGIDYRHVRAIIHACVPESFDRYYQEVGRGGRDGKSCLALALHTPGDVFIARKISRALVISLRRGRQRWTAMYDRRRQLGPTDCYLLPLDVAPSHEPEDIDMRGERNSDWNARVLALMARAGLIELLGAPPRDESLVGPHETVRILDVSHSQMSTWETRVDPVRRGLAVASENSLGLMTQFLARANCPAPLLLGLYGAGAEAHACSRCALCRKDAGAHQRERPRLDPDPPWPTWWRVGERLSALLDSRGRLMVWYDPDALTSTTRRRFGSLLGSLLREGVFSFACVRAPVALVAEAEQVLKSEPAFLTNVDRITQRRLPRGPEMVLIGPAAALENLDLRPRPPGEPQVMFAPRNLRDPMRPDGVLSAAYGGAALDLDTFFARLHA